MIVNNETGEITEEKNENMQLAKRELNGLAVFESWIEAKDRLLAAKEQFDMIDKPFKKKLQEIFEKYDIKSLKNSYIDVVFRNGYSKSSWNSKELEKFIYQQGKDPDEFRNQTWIDGSIQIKYKE